MVFTGSVILYLLIATSTGHAAAAAILQATYVAFIMYFIKSLMVLAHILWKPQVSGAAASAPWRATLECSYPAAAGGIGTGFFYSFYLWTVFGNGFRFGVPIYTPQ
jgi:two-component system sensor histidine kinase RpfC